MRKDIQTLALLGGGAILAYFLFFKKKTETAEEQGGLTPFGGQFPGIPYNIAPPPEGGESPPPGGTIQPPPQGGGQGYGPYEAYKESAAQIPSMEEFRQAANEYYELLVKAQGPGVTFKSKSPDADKEAIASTMKRVYEEAIAKGASPQEAEEHVKRRFITPLVQTALANARRALFYAPYTTKKEQEWAKKVLGYDKLSTTPSKPAPTASIIRRVKKHLYIT